MGLGLENSGSSSGEWVSAGTCLDLTSAYHLGPVDLLCLLAGSDGKFVSWPLKTLIDSCSCLIDSYCSRWCHLLVDKLTRLFRLKDLAPIVYVVVAFQYSDESYAWKHLIVN